MQLINGFHLRNLRGDIFGGLTAAVVALPLALAFGVASGAGAIAGLYGAIFVGFFAALFGGTPAQVSGPTGPMTVVMAMIVTKYAGDPAMAFTIVMMGGAFQILFGVLRLGQYVRLVPYPVISGFMTGIGVIIIILEIGPLLGHADPAGGVLGAVRAIPGFVLSPGRDATIAGILSLAIVLFTPKRIAAIVPSPLIALIVGTLAVYFLLPGAPVIGDIPTGLPKPIVPSFSLEALPDMVKSGVILALLGSIDSLLTSLIADNVSRTRHRSNRELIGQGIGNMVAGFFGGIPGAGATMRTVINIHAGGRTPISGALHALVLFSLLLGLAPLAGYIPHAVLAGILLKVGYDIIDWRYVRRLPMAPRAGVVMMLTVLALTVFVDLIMAVGVGVVMAALLFVKRMADIQQGGMALIGAGRTERLPAEEARLLEESDGAVMLFRFTGPISFGAAASLAPAMGVADCHYLVLDFTDVPMIDTSGTMGLEDAIEAAHAQGVKVFIAGASAQVAKILEALGIRDDSALPPTKSRLDALRLACEEAAAQRGKATD